MTTVDINGLGELLKANYASWEITQMVNLTAPVLNEIAPEGSATLGGTGFIFPVRLTAAESHAYITENQAIPETAQGTVVSQATINPTIQAGTVTLSGLAVAVSSGDAMAFARAFDENVTSTIEAMTAYKEGALFRDGTGILGVVSSEAGSTITLTAEPNHFREGMYIAIKDTGTGTDWKYGAGAGATAARLRIVNVDWVNNTIECDADTGGTVATDVIYLAGSQLEDAADATDREPTGLQASVDASGTYAGISRSGDFGKNWQSSEIAVSGFFDESQLLRGRTRVSQETGLGLGAMSDAFKVVCHPNQTDVLFKLALSRIRYSGNEEFDLGNSRNVVFGNIPFITTYNCALTEAYMGDWHYHKSLYTNGGKLHIDTQYNGSALKWVSSFDRGLVFLKEYSQFLNTKPTCFVKYTSLTAAAK